MASDLTIDHLQAGDALYLAKLHAGCFNEPWSEHSFTDMLSLPTTFGFGVYQGPGLVGFVLASLVVDEAEILTLAVDTALRRQGVAGGLLDVVEATAKARGAQRIFLEVADDNTPARRLYQKRAYKAFGRRPRYYATPTAAIDKILGPEIGDKHAPVDAVLMAKRLL